MAPGLATGYDLNGIYIRDSSGWDTRYLTWSRLYGKSASVAGLWAWDEHARPLSMIGTPKFVRVDSREPMATRDAWEFIRPVSGALRRLVAYEWQTKAQATF